IKILHVIPAIAPRYGGPSTCTAAMCRALNVIPGVTAELATTDADGPGGHLDPAAVPGGFETHLFRRNRIEQWSYSPGLAHWVRGSVRRFAAVHVHGLGSYPTAVAARAAAREGVPYVLGPDGMLSDYCLSVRAWKKRVYTALVERRTLARAAAFHAT